MATLTKTAAITWGDGTALGSDAAVAWATGSALDEEKAIVWGDGTTTDEEKEIVWATGSALDEEKSLAWDTGTPLDLDRELVWAFLIVYVDIDSSIVWADGTAVDEEKSLVWADLTPLDEGKAVAWADGTAADEEKAINWAGGVALDEEKAIDWSTGTPLDEEKSIVWESLIPGTGDHIYSIRWESGQKRDISKEIKWRYLLGTLIMAIEAYLELVSDSSRLPVSNVTIGIDRSSWAWSLSGSTPDFDTAADLAPTASGPVEIELNVNSHAFRALVESVSGSWSFGNRSWSFNGRSPSCIIAAPYDAPTTRLWDAEKNARQIVQEVLDGSGISETWDITDWDIIKNTLSVSNASKIDILRQIATATGAIIQTTPAGSVLEFKYRYAYSPADWSTTAVVATLYADFTINVSWSWNPQPGHDYVVVSGRDAGVLVHVKRSGATFQTPAEAIIDPLVSQEIIGRERGRNLLDATGYDKRMYSLECPFPLPSAAGAEIVYPGDLVAVDLEDGDGFNGIVDAVSISIGGGRAIINITVERVVI